jgi:Flp pilus assembly pilin Flp
MIAKMHLAFNKALRTVNNKKGQSLVEYLFMLGIIVVVVGIVGVAIKTFMPELFDNIKEKILGQAGQI